MEPLLISLIHPEAPEARAAQVIYDAAFEADERVPWDRLWAWLAAPGDNIRPVCWAVSQAGEVVGLAVFGHFRRQNLGYLAYLATRPDLRGRGLGAWLCEQVFAAFRHLAQAERGTDPPLVFWEVRRPQDAPDAAEAERRRHRIAFYARLGAEPLPLDYTCPPVVEGQPSVAFTVMARTFPPGRPLTRAEALAVALTGLIEANGAGPEDDCVAAAVASVDREWGKSRQLRRALAQAAPLVYNHPCEL